MVAADFDQLRLWGVSYTGNLLADLGDDAGAIALSDGCYTLSDNFVLIRREEVMGGEVSLANGDVLANICPGDDMEDLLPFQTTGTTTDQYTYVITDTDNNIVGFAPDGELDFNNLSAPAILRVWGLAYSGIITAQGGDNAATTPLSSECYELSDNFITVIREVPDGGAVSTTDGQTSLYLCTDDGFADEIFFSTTGASNTPYAYLITDENNNVMAVLTDVDSFDFEGAEAGVCRVWGVAYTGAFNVDIVGENAAEVALSDDCYGLSENFITVVRGQLNAGTVTTSSGADIRYTCPGDGESDVITLDSVGAGTGTSCFGFKGGIGTASRRLPAGLPLKTPGYTVGVLVQSNYGGLLTINGQPVGQQLGHIPFKDELNQAEAGSCMVVVATDAPLDSRNLNRLAQRAILGLGRTGSFLGNGSGDFVIAFSTAYRIPHGGPPALPASGLLGNEQMNPLFMAVVEATEEAIYNSLFMATTVVGTGGRTREAISMSF